MGTHHSLLLICGVVSIFISPMYCDVRFFPDRPRSRVYNNRCSRVAIPDGTMVLKHRGRVAKFTCNSGYKLIGDNIATCHQRKWDAIPTCVKNVQCPKEMPKVLNGRMIEYKYVYFKVICNDGYKLPDNIHSIYPCEDFFRPDAKPPVCQLSDTLYCEFEKDTCGWNNTIPYFSWIRYQNATPSHELHTGPGGDHTTGTGHYLYIEASGLPDHEERYAKLTRFFKQVDTPEVCFVFWYHMYGYSIGTLDVYVDFTKVFSKSGNLGDKWRKGIVQRLPSDRDFYISVMATTGNGFAGDIAIDDIGLVNSTDCTKTILIDTTCKSRCFETEVNPKLCKCSSECLIEGTCCTDFMHFCSNDAYTSTATAETTEWEVTTGWESSADGVQTSVLVDSSTAGYADNGEGSTEMYAGSTTQQDSSLSGDWSNGVSDVGELQDVTVGSATSQDYTTASVSIHGGDYTESAALSDLSKWWSSTQQEQSKIGRKWPSTEEEQREVGRKWPSTEDEQHEIGKKWPSTQQEPHGSSRWSTQQDQHDITSKSSSAQQYLHDSSSSSRLPSTQQDLHVTTKWPATQQETDDVSSIFPSTQPGPGPNLGSMESSTSPTSAKGVSPPEGIEGTAISISINTTPALTPESHTEQTTVVTPAKTTLSISTETTSATSVTSPLTSKLQNESASAVPLPTTRNYPSSEPSRAASHTHLHQENDYDEFDESTQAATQLKQLETTPSTQETRKPYKWKKTYEPKGRYTFSAVKYENKTTTYVSILIGVAVFLAAVVVAAYIFRRRRAIRFRDATEESDVLYMTSDDILDFNIARRPTSGNAGQPIPGPSSSQQTTRMCQSDFSFCSNQKLIQS